MSMLAIMSSINSWFTGIPVISLIVIAIWFITWLICCSTIGPNLSLRMAITAPTSKSFSSRAAHISNIVAFSGKSVHLQVLAEPKGLDQRLLL